MKGLLRSPFFNALKSPFIIKSILYKVDGIVEYTKKVEDFLSVLKYVIIL
ncbi:hypothetical protein [Peptacetobacter hiranonis]|nr:hypothetical protein [Peptacetobacter hiranonis]